MCIIVYKPKNKDFNFKYLRNCWNYNSDGAGLMYNNFNKVIIRKGFMNYNEFIKAVKMIPDYKNKDVVLHFRISTSGGVNPECTHPFNITHDFNKMRKNHDVASLAFAHNGILRDYIPSSMQEGYKINDTMLFNYSILSKLSYKDFKKEHIIELIKNAIGSSNKLAILDGKKAILIGDFLEDKGIYYSNSTYKGYSRYTYTNPVKYYTKYDIYDSYSY